MNRVIRGTVVLAAVIGVLSCKGDPTSDLRNGVDHLIADPGALFADTGETKLVIVQAVDAQGNLLGAHFSLGTVGAGITVVEDDSFNLVYDNNGNLVRPSDPTRVRYIVTATANTGSTSFVVSAGGKSITIPVRILPNTLPTPTVSNNTPALGDTVTMTLPAPFIWLPTTGIVIYNATDTSTAAVVNISADGRTIYFVPLPDIATSNVAISGFGLDYAPTATSLNTDAIGTIATPPLPTITFAPASAAAADTIVATSTGPFRFTAASATTLSDGGHSTVVGVSADSLTLKFLAGPSVHGALSVSDMEISGAPALGTFTLTAGTDTLTTAAAPPLAVSPTTASAGDTITVTAPAAYRFTKDSRPSVAGAGLLYLDYSSDSTSLRFVAGPSANDQVVVDNMVYVSVPDLGLFTLNSGATVLTTPAVPNFPATFSTTAPALNDTVTMTVGTGFRILPNASVIVNGETSFIVSVSADSLTIMFVPPPGGAATAPVVDGITLDFLTSVPLTIPANGTITPPAMGTPLAGADAFATAPTITFPASGSSVVFYDFGPMYPVAECLNDLGGDCRVYKFVLTATTTFDFSEEWQDGTDMGVYFYDSTMSLLGIFGCDSNGDGPGGQPEACSATLDAGTYYFVTDDFGPFYNPPDPAPTWQRFRIAVQ